MKGTNALFFIVVLILSIVFTFFFGFFWANGYGYNMPEEFRKEVFGFYSLFLIPVVIYFIVTEPGTFLGRALFFFTPTLMVYLILMYGAESHDHEYVKQLRNHKEELFYYPVSLGTGLSVLGFSDLEWGRKKRLNKNWNKLYDDLEKIKTKSLDGLELLELKGGIKIPFYYDKIKSDQRHYSYALVTPNKTKVKFNTIKKYEGSKKKLPIFDMMAELKIGDEKKEVYVYGVGFNKKTLPKKGTLSVNLTCMGEYGYILDKGFLDKKPEDWMQDHALGKKLPECFLVKGGSGYQYRGKIKKVREVVNEYTKEELYILGVEIEKNFSVEVYYNKIAVSKIPKVGKWIEGRLFFTANL